MTAQDNKPTVLTPVSLNDLVDYQEGSVVSNTLVKKEKGTVTLFAFDAGEGLSEHTAPFDALVQVVDGEADVSVGEEKYRVASGEVLLLPADIPHSVQSNKRFKMLLTMIRV
jgi:quercetin dioxygenase-like cupin family protein